MEVLDQKVFIIAKAIAEGENNKLEIFIYYSHCPNVVLPLCEYLFVCCLKLAPKRDFSCCSCCCLDLCSLRVERVNVGMRVMVFYGFP